MADKSEHIIKGLEDWNKLDILARSKINTGMVKPFKVTITGTKRTIDQNSLVHAIFMDCAKKMREFGVEKDADWWKEKLKTELGLKKVYMDLDDQPFLVVVSTTEYSTKQMGDFCKKIQAYMKIEHGIDIVLPNEDDDLNNNKTE